MEKWMDLAREMGFDEVAPCKIETLKPMAQVREMCAADKCRAYNQNWTCPPHCGSLEECREKIGGYHHGVLLQTVGYLSKTIDSRCYRETEQRHLENFRKLTGRMRQEYPDLLALGAGGCRVCSRCAYPQPCRFPEEATSSMEGYGLFVTQVCRDNGILYHHGEKTITYTACILF